ncbi:YciI family protein [Paraurantiacibacter namhicola]|uniref:YciI-like protein n=1 Tax=Paraurantiacibacter namhicola TaxID=645517 RepID=A0A1C7D4H5_9SPHN|nr:YciI family protein [Paraurantiacibacter namhicola]ANU06358.1 YciI-like protein [Paraurantiacibacter namhicola]
MKLFAFSCRDGEHGAELRQRVLQEHLDHIETHMERYAVAGPLREKDATIGSLLVIRAHDMAEARSFFEADPYFDAGVWQAISAAEFIGAAGDWVGGAAWKA